MDATGARFNMFSVCGVNRYENTHSAIIAELLNPDGSHGLRSKLLECFIETLGDKFIVQGFNPEKSRVYTEYSIDGGRMDILIEDDRNKAIVIENKIDAGDQWEQLKRYDRYSERRYGRGNYQILYLTPYGNEASEQSGGGVAYLPVSYRDTIVKWLERCSAITARHPIVRETLFQYINHIKQLTNQDMDTKNKEEMVELLSKIDNLKAAKVIYQNYSVIFDILAERHFNPEMEKFAREKGLEYHYEKSEEPYIKFYFTNPAWKGRCWIGFTYERCNFFYGICNDLNAHRLPDEKRAILRERLGRAVAPYKESEWWPFYTYLSNLTIDKWESEIIESDRFLNSCKEKTEQLLAVMAEIEL